MTEFEERLVAWLRALPAGAALDWYNDSFNHGDHLCRGWVDVHVDAIEEALGCAWVWTFVAGEADGEEVTLTPDVIDDDGPGWTPPTVAAGIERWCLDNAGRLVTPVWEINHGPSPMLAAALEAKAAVESGDVDSYVLKPGAANGGVGFEIRASGPVMDCLIELAGKEGGPEAIGELFAVMEAHARELDEAD